MLDILKEMIGDKSLNYNDLEAMINEKGLKLADLSGGAYVAKGKFDELVKKNSEMLEQLKELDVFKAKADELTKAVEAAMAEKSELETNYNAQFKTLLAKFALEQAGAHDAGDALAMMDINKLELAEGQLQGIAELIEQLKTNKAYMFKNASNAGGAAASQPPVKTAVAKTTAKDLINEDISKIRRY